MTKINVPLSCPLTAADEPRAINRLALQVAAARHRWSKEFTREWLQTTLRRYLREGGLTIAVKAVEAADTGDEIADAALREVGAELQMPLLQRLDLAPGHLQVVAYFQRAGGRAPLRRKRGRYGQHDHWDRNIAICILIQLACERLGVGPTRDLNGRRTKPSGISLVTAALGRNKIHLDEKTIQQHIWFGIWGELMRQFAPSGRSRIGSPNGENSFKSRL
jgi:hypothetical protein